MNASNSAGHEDVLVSVIIPVYNVEKYAARCFDSVLSQTYRNLEILMIDDGSTDGSGKICDDYAGRDERIRVIHQENQGLAEVRNVGIREAKGEWIQFVDSDDWIDPETIETCYRYAAEYDVDIVSFCFVNEYEGGGQKHMYRLSPEPVLMSSNEALGMIFFHAYISTSSCNKFFRASLFSGISYPRNKLWEDAYTTFKIIAKAERIVSVSQEFYHYFMRNESIVHDDSVEAINFSAESGRECYDFIIENYDLNETERSNLNMGFNIWRLGSANKMLKSNNRDNEYLSNFRKDIHPLEVLKCRYISLRAKAQFLIIKVSPLIYKYLYKFLKRH